MAKLLEQINSDLKAAMIAKDAFSLSVLRMLIAAMRNKEITLRKDGKAELADEQVSEVIGSEVKKRRDSAEAYSRGGRPELADKENAEIKILEKYLPEQLSDEELEKVVKEIIAAAGAGNLPAGEAGFGKVMGRVMERVKGKADGGKAGDIVKKILAK
ncbi:GatB/YqeY domain-containing protein [Candidatus Falkowbacteria bacterium]|nr:GatB/YqeY domain-containing protein [Candidatus Falkowbacteria bacterium]